MPTSALFLEGQFIMKAPTTLLLIDRSGTFFQPVRSALPPDMYRIITATGPAEVFQQLAQDTFAILLVGVKKISSLNLWACVEIRKRSTIPIILLSDTVRPDDIVRGLKAGADDVLGTEQMIDKVLRLRIAVLLRRSRQMQQQTLHRVGNIVLNEATHEVTVDDRLVHLRPQEYELLHCLMTHAGQPVDKKELGEAVWNSASQNPSVIEMAIRRLREKIENIPSRPEYIITVRGVGYALVPAKASDGIR